MKKIMMLGVLWMYVIYMIYQCEEYFDEFVLTHPHTSCPYSVPCVLCIYVTYMIHH